MVTPSAEATRMRFGAWLAVAAWALVILALGTDSFSSSGTSRILGPILDLLFPGLDPGTRATIHALIRKFAHFFEYAVLGALAWNALQRPEERRTLRAGALALALAFAVACADEGGQSFRASRGGSPRDVVLDTAGAGFGVCMALGLRSAVDRRRRAG